MDARDVLKILATVLAGADCGAYDLGMSHEPLREALDWLHKQENTHRQAIQLLKELSTIQDQDHAVRFEERVEKFLAVTEGKE